MRAAREKVIVSNATGCLEVFSTPYPESSWRIAWMHSLFGNAAAAATGIAAAQKVKGRTDVRVALVQEMLPLLGVRKILNRSDTLPLPRVISKCGSFVSLLIAHTPSLFWRC
jgi:pyruvate/2-oxoacid:ferredoxin oxidoreductase beta subunit